MPALTTDRFVRIAPLFLIALCLLALPGPDLARSAPPPDAGAASAGSGDLPLAALRAPEAAPPTTVTLDDEDYTIWSVDWSSGSWCVPVSTIRYPLDLGGQDPDELEDATLKLYFSEGLYHEDVQDTSWTVALNGRPPDDWRDVGTISGPATHGKVWTSSAPIEIDTDLLHDGVNNIWLRQHDLCPQSPGCETCACTCIELRRVELRAALDLTIKNVSPAQDTKNLALDQSYDPEINVTFSAPPDPETVNENTFQVYYYDDQVYKVYVEGKPRRITPTSYGFVSDNKLRDGVRYFAKVWGKEDAEAASRDQWIAHETGQPLEEGRLWSFWTIPELKVELVAAQVLEVGYLDTLVVYKPTVLRVFVRWDLKPDVYFRHQARDVELHDVVVSWKVLDGSHEGESHWKDDYGWRPVRDAKTGVRKREYREYTTAEESYSKHEKLYARDSVNFFGFIPLESGSYTLGARVEVKDSRGEVQPFKDGITRNANAAPRLGVYMRPAAVGADYGKTGTVDLSAVVTDQVSGLKAIYPAPNVTRPAAPTAMSWYNPTSTFWVFDWSTSPAWWKPKVVLLQEMSMLCARTTGCRAMVALVPDAWLVDLGLTARESAPRGALVVNSSHFTYRFLVAH
ncbi:MAG: hypothetical protein H8E35_15060 [Ardenticatenia bacterium]|nr:hypothetical protein [Ardenticatenia bacterium]